MGHSIHINTQLEANRNNKMNRKWCTRKFGIDLYELLLSNWHFVDEVALVECQIGLLIIWLHDPFIAEKDTPFAPVGCDLW